jgi:N-acyl homoserine lactone hydrolase
LCDLPGCEVHVHRDEIRAAATRLDAGVFEDEWADAGHWRMQSGEYEIAAGVRAVDTPGPVILCGDAADLTENLSDEIAPGYCWQDDEARAIASIRKLNALSRSANAELWPNHDFPAYRSWAAFPEWRD